mmetsp:Transcript_28491/g.52442  ORF Transcript_28491/g.52442 Transcript_28491/m.52442 type:complete len:147 (-) Transcript_28491:331-771(-)
MLSSQISLTNINLKKNNLFQCASTTRSYRLSEARRSFLIKALPFDKEKLERARKQVAENTRQIQVELAKKQYEGFDANETVRVVFNGNQVPVSVEITEEAYQKGPEELSKRITEALKNSHHESVEGLKTAMTELARKLGIQGLAGL